MTRLGVAVMNRPPLGIDIFLVKLSYTKRDSIDNLLGDSI